MGKLRSQGLSAPQGNQGNKIAKRKANLIKLRKRDANRRQIREDTLKAFADACEAKHAADKETRRLFEEHRDAYYEALDTAPQWQHLSQAESEAVLAGLCDAQREYLEARSTGAKMPHMTCKAQVNMVTSEYCIKKGETLSVLSLSPQLQYLVARKGTIANVVLGNDAVLGDFNIIKFDRDGVPVL